MPAFLCRYFENCALQKYDCIAGKTGLCIWKGLWQRTKDNRHLHWLQIFIETA